MVRVSSSSQALGLAIHILLQVDYVTMHKVTLDSENKCKSRKEIKGSIVQW